MFVFLAWWLPLCAVVAWLASQKGRSGVGFFFLSLFLSPLVGLLAVIAVPHLEPARRTPKGNDFVLCHSCNRPRRVDAITCPHCGVAKLSAPAPVPAASKKCPMCAEMIQAEALKCRYCGAEQANDATAPTVSSNAVPTMGYCPGCRKLRASNVEKCIYCGDSSMVA